MFYMTGQSSTHHLEYYEKFKIKKDVQRLVETPELYMIGQCTNNDEQLGYIETCVACLKGLKKRNQFE